MVDTETRCKHGMIAAYCAFESPAAIAQSAEQAGQRRASRSGRQFQKRNIAGMWGLIGFLAVRAMVSIRARDGTQAGECEAEYFAATGEAIVVDINLTKWGHSIEFRFGADDFDLARVGIPLEWLAASTRMTHDRMLSNAALGWALFALGFRVGRQDVEGIRMCVPATSALAAFDRGVGIGRQS